MKRLSWHVQTIANVSSTPMSWKAPPVCVARWRLARPVPIMLPPPGRVVLAFKDESWVRNYPDNTPLHGITAQTMASPARLPETLKDVRCKGVSQSIEKTTDGGAGHCGANPFR